MKRKDFFLTGIPLLGAVNALSQNKKGTTKKSTTSVIPPYLKKGDTIAISSPAGYIKVEELIPAITKLENWGFKVKLGDTPGKKDFVFGGTDEERLKDFQQLMDDDKVKAIMCARGGYGLVRIIDKLDFKKFRQKPKWVIGFSDITVFHEHIAQFNIASIHSKMCNSFPADETKAEPIQLETIDSIRKTLLGTPMEYPFAFNSKNKIGKASGILIGGNLKTIESNSGSKSDINTDGKILFVEDTGEYLYSIDRMFWNLKRNGKLKNLKALIIGGFKIKKDENTEDFGKTLEDIVLEKTKEYSYPVCFDFPVGHQKNNYALKCGVLHQIEVLETGCTLKEIV
jgi:muramoyltetrapeptide carboxypeptidase